MARLSSLSVAYRLCTLILSLSLFGITATLSVDRKNILSEVGKIERSIQKSSIRKNSLEKRAHTLAVQVDNLRNRAAKAAQHAQLMEKNLSKIDRRLSHLALEHKANKGRLEHLQANLIQSVVALARLQRQPAFALLVKTNTLLDAVRAGQLLTVAVPNLQKDTIKVREVLSSNQEVRRKLKDQQHLRKIAIAALLARRAELNYLLKRRAAQESRLRKAGITEGRRLAKLAAKAKDLNTLLRRLEKGSLSNHSKPLSAKVKSKQVTGIAEQNRQRLAAEIANTLATSPKKSGKSAYPQPKRISPERNVSEKKLALAPQPRPFSTLRGRLRIPAHGTLVGQFGENSNFGARTQGITLRTRQGAQVIAPYEGRVVFAGPFRNYGLILIIEHGEGYHTLLAGLTTLHAVVGQHLLTGEPMGTMGGDKKRSLYVELRRNGQPINPNPWWSKSGERESG